MSEDYEAPEVLFSEGSDCFHVGKPNVRKISGTSLGAILGYSPWESPFTCSAKMHRLWNKDISDRPAVITGKALEERIIDYVADKHPEVGDFFKAEDLYPARTGPHDEWPSDFDDPDFKGHIDGIVTKDGQDYILEVKTVNLDPRSKRRDMGEWENGTVPAHYLWQAYLYNHFITKQDKAYFAIGIVNNDTYSNPYAWVPNKENCLLIEVPIDREAVAEGIEKAREIRHTLIETGCTLPFDLTDPRDREIWQHLHDIGADAPHLYDLISEYEAVNKAIEEKESEYKDMTDRADMLWGRIKDIMGSRNLSKAGKFNLTTSERRTFDFAKAKADGLDIDGYVKTTSVKTLRRIK